jgi:hypothetical protein
VPIPSIRARPWYVRETWPALIALAVGLVGSAGAIMKELFAPKPNGAMLSLFVASFFGVFALGALKLAQSRHKDQKDKQKETPESLKGCLHVLHAVIAGLKAAHDPPDGWMRVTLHRVNGDTLEQSVDYVGSEDGGAGRIFKIESGLIGRVARRKEVRSFDRGADVPFESWVDWLVDEAGMTRESAERTRKDRFSFLGVPLKSPGDKDVRAVVYLDAHEALFFDDETRDAVLDACAGLAAWIDEHYYPGKE